MELKGKVQRNLFNKALSILKKKTKWKVELTLRKFELNSAVLPQQK